MTLFQSISSEKPEQNSSRDLNSALSKLHSPVSQSTKSFRFKLITVLSIPDLVSYWPKRAQPSGILDRASCISARVQLIRSPTTLFAPMTVWMEKASNA